MKIAGVDTSLKTGSVALIEGDELIDEIHSQSARSFSRSLLGMMEELLARHRLRMGDLSAMACATGPGSFTGIRIGLASLMGASLASGIPVHGVSTLEAMARACDDGGGTLVPVIDAGGGGMYLAAFEGGRRVRPDEHASVESALASAPRGAVFFGDAPEGMRKSLASRFDEKRMTRSAAAGAARAALQMAASGSGGAPEELRPNYIRKSYAEKE